MKKLKDIIQVLEWLPTYKFQLFRFDLIAGITLAFFVFPESMAYASLAGVPPAYGVYSILAAGLLFALFTGSNHAVVGPTSAISLMVGTTVAVLSGGDMEKWAAIASLTALMIFVLCLLAYFLRLSSLVSFISESILLGFKAGAALTIITTQLPKIMNVHTEGGNFFMRIYSMIEHIGEVNTVVLLFGITAFVILFLGDKFLPGRPVSLIVVAGAIIIFSTTNIASYGFHLAGEIASGLPPLSRPSLRFRDVDGVLGLALGCFLMGYIETMAVARTFAEKYDYPINARQELKALGFANLAAAFTHGYPVSGGLSQSTVNDKSGAKSPMSLIVCSGILIIILLFFTGLLKNLPEVILAVIVIDAVLGLIKIKELKKLFGYSKMEFAVAMIALVSVLSFGILKGVLIAAFGSIIILIAKSKLANVAVLGKIPGTNRFSDITRNPDNVELTDIKILRIESSIFYYNEEDIHRQLSSATYKSGKQLKHVILDLSASPVVDVAGGKMLLKFYNELKSNGINLKIVESLGVVRDLLRKLGMEDLIGHISRKDSIQNEVEIFISPSGKGA